MSGSDNNQNNSNNNGSGGHAAFSNTSSSSNGALTKKSGSNKRRRRWGDAPPTTSTENIVSSSNKIDKAAALQESIRARLAALKQKQKSTTTTTTTTTTTLAPPPPPTKRAKVYDLDLNKISTPISSAIPTLTASIDQTDLNKNVIKGGGHNTNNNKDNNDKKNKESNPYLSHRNQSSDNDGNSANDNTNDVNDGELLMDERLAGGHTSKVRVRGKAWNFVEPGAFIALAEKKRQKALNAQQAGFSSGRKMGEFIQNTSGIAYYGPASSDSATVADDTTLRQNLPPPLNYQTTTSSDNNHDTMPLVMEWWDLEYLPSKQKKQITSLEQQALKERTKSKLKAATTTLSTTKNSKDESPSEEQIQHDLEQQQKKEEEEKEKKIEKLRDTCFQVASIQNSKTYILVQHPPPLISPEMEKSLLADSQQQKQPTLYLTKKERKRQRKLRREERSRELRDLQAAGLEPPPEPRLTLQNFMRVLGQQAVLDPSQMEIKVQQQIEARQLEHQKRNEERKLTKEQRAAKRDRKLFNDTNENSTQVAVALFYVKDMSHTYHRTKVDLNAQQNKLTGGVLECLYSSSNNPISAYSNESESKNQNNMLSAVICEGGPKAIKRFVRLMCVRMKWTGEGLVEQEHPREMIENNDNTSESPAPQKFNPDNHCHLVWTGMAPKRVFKSFNFQACTSPDIARAVFENKGVGHFWDEVLQYHQNICSKTAGIMTATNGGVTVKLTNESDESDDDGPILEPMVHD